RIAAPADVHVESRRVRSQNMIMDSGDFESIFDRRCHYGRDLTFKQHQIAHHHRAAMDRFECRPATERECRPYGYAVQRYAQISPRKAVSMNVAGYSRRTSKRIIDFLPISFLSRGPTAHNDGSGQNKNTSHSQCSFSVVPGAIDRQASQPALQKTEMIEIAAPALPMRNRLVKPIAAQRLDGLRRLAG